MQAFEFPAGPYIRRHGPAGYGHYESYRDWLRDEFTFRCVYCLHRERWYNRSGTFHIDHFVPVSVDPDGKCEYLNLLYACATCNEAKNSLDVPDPCKIAFQECIQVTADGGIKTLNEHGDKLNQVLRLDSEKNVRHRSRWIRILEAAKKCDPALFEELMGFPDDLPDLQRKHVQINTKPEGVANCYFALRERGELPTTY